MRYYELLEYVLVSEFTMGFELECISKKEDNLSNLYNSIFENNGKYKMNIGNDSTIKITKKGYEPWELRSEIFNITPKNITNIIKFLSKLNENDIFTNESCGFHIHLKFPTYDNKESYWLLLNLSVDENMLNKLTKFKEYNFINEKYANLNYLNKLQDYVLNLDNIYIEQDYKYNLLTTHEQGTLEWRGPRDFLNKPQLHEIKDFFILLYEFVSWISKTVSKKELNNKSKDFWLEKVKKSISKNLINFLNEIVDNKNKKYIKILNNMSDDILFKLIKYNPYVIEHINNPSEHMQLEAVKQNGDSIQHINNPSEQVQLEAVKAHGLSIRYIENPSEQVQLEAVKQSGLSIRYIENPSEQVQLEAVKQSGLSIRYIENPSEQVQYYILNNYPEIKDLIENPTIPELVNK